MLYTTLDYDTIKRRIIKVLKKQVHVIAASPYRDTKGDLVVIEQGIVNFVRVIFINNNFNKREEEDKFIEWSRKQPKHDETFYEIWTHKQGWDFDIKDVK